VLRRILNKLPRLVDDLVITVQPPPPPEERRRRYADEEEDGEWEEWEEEVYDRDNMDDNMVEECPSFRQDKASAIKEPMMCYDRRKIRIIESNAKCRYLKKLTC
jgi:hypothetical protein